MPEMMPLVNFAFITLLPIVPAYLLFRALPSTGAVQGTLLRGLEVKLGGAFAGYLVVFLLILYKHDVIFPPPPPQGASVWHLHGRVFDDQDKPIEPLDVKDFVFAPPTFQALPGGHFTLTIPTEPAEGGGTRLPMLVISHGTYSRKVPLEPSQFTPTLAAALRDSRKGQEITMERIQLEAEAPYNPSGPTPSRLSGPVPQPSGEAFADKQVLGGSNHE